jgi:hypothetical protein
MARADARFRALRLAVTTSMDDLDDSIVILNKSALAVLADEDFYRLKNRGNVLIADPLDAVLSDAFLAKFDCVVAAAREQLAYYQGAVATRTSYIAHHIDMRIPPIAPRADRFSIGYFGEIINARYTRELRGSVSFVSVDTRMAEDTRWMNELAHHNAHYLIRAHDEPGSFKPFTKGFIAAHCASPVLVARNDREARHFLPSSYPYLADADEVEDVRRAISRMRDGFMAEEWRLAQQCMRGILESCSRATVCGQIYETVAAYV